MHEDETQPSAALVELIEEAFDRAFPRLVESGEDELRQFALLERSDGEIVERLLDEGAETLAPLHDWVLEQAADAARYTIAFSIDVEAEDGSVVAAIGLEAAEGDAHAAFVIVAPYRWKEPVGDDDGALEVVDGWQVVGNAHTALHSHDHDHEHDEEELSDELYDLLQAAIERATTARNAGAPTTFGLIGFEDGEPREVVAGDPSALEDLERAVRDASAAARYVLVSDTAVFAESLPDRAFRLEIGEAGSDHGLILLQPYELDGAVVRTVGEPELVDRVGLLVPG